MGRKPTNQAVRFWRDPDLAGVEARFSSYNEEAFRTHVHPAYSIGFLETGQTTFALDGGSYTARAGQMVFIGPNLPHACNPDLDSDMTYVMFYVVPSWVESVAGEVFGPSGDAPCFPVPVVEDRELADHWRNLLRAMDDGADQLEKESLLIQGLADALARHGSLGQPVLPTGNERAVRQLKALLAANLTEKIGLDALAQHVGLSRYHLLRLFRDSTGLPPHAFQNQLRVDLAKSLLAKGLAISRVAVEAGFSDQAHLTRVFRQYTGATPRQYRDAGPA